MYIDDVDFFIVENKSENSSAIESYFRDKNLKGYIQFNDNISSTALDIFISDYDKLISEYDYITITDGDLYLYDINTTLKEIKLCLDDNDIVIASTRLYQGNHYMRKDRIIGMDHYDRYMESKKMELGANIGHTGGYLMTVKNKNIWAFQNFHITDSNIKGKVKNAGKKWAHCKYSESYHLTWDLYVDGNPYYDWKKKVIRHIWSPKKHTSYKVIK